MRIIDVSPAHAALLSEIHHESFGQDYWEASSLKTILLMPHTFAGLAMEGEHPLGFVVGQAIADEVEIFTLCVLPGNRKRGVGATLLTWLIEYGRAKGAQQIFLEVAQNNLPAIALYKKLGFECYTTRPHYYPDGQHALLFKLGGKMPSALGV